MCVRGFNGLISCIIQPDLNIYKQHTHPTTHTQILCYPFLQLLLRPTGCIQNITIGDDPETAVPRRNTPVNGQDTETAPHG